MKIRKWFFKLLTGYDLVEYREILNKWSETVDYAQRVNDLSQEILDDAKKVTVECNKLLAMCNEVNKNETLG